MAWQRAAASRARRFDAMSSPDVVVIGLGAMGAATVLALAKRGVNVVGIDRYAPPHHQGSTHGETRITREAIGEGVEYVPLVQRSHALWRELEGETGMPLFTACGALFIARRGRRSLMHEQPDFVGATVAAARRFNIAHEVLHADEIARRYPQLRLEGDEHAYFEPGGGYVNPEAALTAMLHMAQTLGARLITSAAARLTYEAGVARVETETGSFRPHSVVVAAGAWLPQMVPSLAAHLVVRRQVLHWFPVSSEANYHHDQFPVYIWNWGDGADDWFYGFPQVAGAAEIKVAGEERLESTTPEKCDRVVHAAETAAMFARHLAPRMRGVMPQASRSITCLYTVAPKARFVIDRVPNHPATIVVSACSGHGFKHSGGVGEAVAAFAMQGTHDQAPAVLRPFSWPPDANS
jgi:sarcosine oxidase